MTDATLTQLLVSLSGVWPGDWRAFQVFHCVAKIETGWRKGR